MRCAILADIHANLAAFTAVLDDIERWGGVGELWCLGDVVGYGPDPHECIELLCRYNHVCVAGNHDWAASGRIDTSDFNPVAAAACRWTSGQLSPGDVEYLDTLPLTVNRDDFTLVHGSPRDPVREYLLSTSGAGENFVYFETPYCLAGHSHVPLIFELDETGACNLFEFPDGAALTPGRDRLIINPGSVGQSRDGDPRASYAIYDHEAGAIAHHRVAYDIGLTQAKMMEHGLPLPLINRLGYGI